MTAPTSEGVSGDGEIQDRGRALWENRPQLYRSNDSQQYKPKDSLGTTFCHTCLPALVFDAGGLCKAARELIANGGVKALPQGRKGTARTIFVGSRERTIFVGSRDALAHRSKTRTSISKSNGGSRRADSEQYDGWKDGKHTNFALRGFGWRSQNQCPVGGSIT
jgi:hypothetical protein